MTQTEALKLALEALEEIHVGNMTPMAEINWKKAITAIKEALAQPEQEPVGQLLEDAFGRGQVMWFNKPKDESMLYTTPPQRTWVGLTDDEFEDIELGCRSTPFGKIEAMRMVEAKLKEKNT